MGKIDVDQRQRVYHDLLQQAKEHKSCSSQPIIRYCTFSWLVLGEAGNFRFSLLTEAAQLKDAEAISLLPHCILKKYLVRDDPQKAFELYQTAYQFKPLFINQVGLALCYYRRRCRAKYQASAATFS